MIPRAFRRTNAVHCRFFARALEARGHDPGPLLAQVGLTAEDVARFDVPMTVDGFLRFVQLCVEATNDESVGLHAGEQVRMEDLDIVGLLARSAPVMQDAYDIVERYQHPWDRARDACVLLVGEQLVYRHTRISPGATPRTWGEYFAARTSTLKQLVGGQLEPLEVRFMHAEPSDLCEYRRIFGAAPLTFEAQDNELIFSTRILLQRLPHADPIIGHVLAPLVDERSAAVARRASDLPSRVRSAVLEQLEGGRLTLPRISRQLNQSERSLRRHLRSCGTSYQAIVNELRYELALKYLSSGLDTVEVSRRLAFGEPGAFYRAFKRWTGQAVSEYRRQAT